MSSAASLYKQVVKELARHHKAAAEAQTAAVRKNQAAKRLYAKRSGKPDEASSEPEYTPKPFDAAPVKEMFKLHEMGEKDVAEVVEFLKHQRQYKELLERYTVGPSDTLDRVKMTARRVGLSADDL